MSLQTTVGTEEVSGKDHAVPSEGVVASIERGIADADSGRSEEGSIVLKRLRARAAQAQARRDHGKARSGS